MPRKNNSNTPQQRVITPTKYAGNLIYKAEGSAESGINFYDRGTQQIIDCTNLIRLLAIRHLHTSSKKKVSKKGLEKAQENLAEREDMFRAEFDPEIFKIITQGKLRFHLLFNTDRGSEYVYDDLLVIMDYVRARKGLVEAYGKEKVQGFPALVFMQADVRYAIAKTQFKWYLDWYEEIQRTSPQLIAKEMKDNEKRKNVQTAFTRDILLANTKKANQKEMKAALFGSAGARKDPPEFIFTGTELMELGIVHRLFTDMESLKAQFVRNLDE